MDILGLPLELFQAIMKETVWMSGYRQSLDLRLVSNLFNTEVQRAIYALPTFDSINRHLLPEHLRPPCGLHPSMKARLILSKMKTKDSSKRVICVAITDAVDYLEEKLKQNDTALRQKFIEALAGAAAHNLKLHHLSDCLVTEPSVILERIRDRYQRWHRRNPLSEPSTFPIQHLTPGSGYYVCSVPQNALVSAVLSGHSSLVNDLLESGVDVITRRNAFGMPLQAMAAVGALDMVRTVLNGSLAKCNGDGIKRSEMSRRAKFSVIRGATVGGHVHIVQMMLEEYDDRPGTCVSGNIASAVRNGHEPIAALLLQHRTPMTLREHTVSNSKKQARRKEERFLRKLITTSERFGCKSIRNEASDQLVRFETGVEK